MKKYGTMLLVDDEKDLGEIYQTIFSDMFEKVIFCSDARDALKVAESTELSIILSDFNMPGVNGAEFLTTIRSKGNLTPVVFLTGFASKDFAIQAIKLGAVDILEKPVDIPNLLSNVDRILEIEKRKRNLDPDSEQASRDKKIIGLLQVVNDKKSKGA